MALTLFERIRRKWETWDVEVVFSEQAGHPIMIHKISVPSRFRGQGLGTQVLQDLCRAADKRRIRLEVIASDVYGAKITRLKRFYARQGFEGERAMFRSPVVLEIKMIRKPRNKRGHL
jgi:GNAT superfamily N-acetyltransferase